MPANVLSVSDPLLQVGDQTPRILVAPAAPTSAAAEVIELAADVGLELDPWQCLVLEHALGESVGGKWSSFEVGLTVPRQNGKSALIEARMLAGMLLWDEDVIVYSAHEFRTVITIMRRVERLLKNSGEQFQPKRSHGQEGFVLGPDANDPDAPVMLFSSRTKVSGRGLTGDTVILDEAMIIKPDAIGALMPTLASRPNPQLWYAGSAVDQLIHEHGHVFSGVRKRAMDRVSPRLCYLEWGCEEGADPTSARERARSNPSMGYRITPEYIEDEYQAIGIHTPKIFAVERLGIGDWPTLADTMKPPIGVDLWRDLEKVDPGLFQSGPQTIAVDRAPDSKMWAIAGAIRTRAGVHVELGYYQLGSATEVTEKLLDIITDADPVALVIDAKSPAAILKPYLLEAGIEPVITNSVDLALACEGFLDATHAHQISHSGQKLLEDAVACAVKRELPGDRFAWGKPPGGSIVQLVAVTLAHWALLTFAKPPGKASAPLLVAETEDLPSYSEFDPLSAAF